MDIKIGFSDTSREVIISSADTQEEVIKKIDAALRDDSGVLRLTDKKGREFLARNSRIAYVEVGTVAAAPVGFAH